jgi:hypothetical protein
MMLPPARRRMVERSGRDEVVYLRAREDEEALVPHAGDHNARYLVRLEHARRRIGDTQADAGLFRHGQPVGEQRRTVGYRSGAADAVAVGDREPPGERDGGVLGT